MSFTEEELTKMAMLKAESMEAKDAPGVNITPKPEKLKPTPTPTPTSEPKPSVKKVTKIETETQPVLSFPHELVLGNNKIIHFTNWTGKTKKVFNKLLETKGDDISLADISKNLIREYIQEKDIYLSPLEEQYLIVKIREISLSEDYEFVSSCPECEDVVTITDKTSKIYKYKPSTFPSEFNGFKFVDIKLDSEFKAEVQKIQTSPNYDGLSTEADIEIAMHIQKDNKSASQVLDLVDTLSLKDIRELFEALSNVSPDLTMGVTKVCPNCSVKVFFEAEEIPNIFEELV